MLAALFALSLFIILTIVNRSSGEFKTQRIFFYLAPFIAILVGWGSYVIMTGKEKWSKRLVMACIVGSVLVSAIGLPFTAEKINVNDTGGVLWQTSTQSIEGEIATGDYNTMLSRAMGDNNYLVHYIIFEADNHRDLIFNLKGRGARGIFLPEMLHREYSVSGSYSQLLYRNGDCTVWLI